MIGSIPWPSQAITCINEHFASYKWSQIHPPESNDSIPRTSKLVTSEWPPAHAASWATPARRLCLALYPSLLFSILHSSFKLTNPPPCSASRGYWANTVMWKFSKALNEEKRTKGILLRMKALWSIPLFSLYFHLNLSISLWPFVILSHWYTSLCDVTSRSDRRRTCAFL